MSDEAKPYTKADSNEDNWSNVLLRPDGSEVCILGEPEDRNFARDGSAILDELNCLAAERDSLRAQRDALMEALEEAQRRLVDGLPGHAHACISLALSKQFDPAAKSAALLRAKEQR